MKRIFKLFKKQYLFTFVLILFLGSVSTLRAQSEFNIFGELGIPNGSFSQNTKAVGIGFGSNFIHPIDRKQQLLIGGELNYEIYGKEVKDDALGSSELITNNNIFMMHAMIRFMPYHQGLVKPYVDLKGGFKHFYTKTKVKEDMLASDPVEVISEFTDFAGSYGGSFGVNFRKSSGVGLFAEISFLAGGRASYVDRKSFERTPDNEIVFEPKTSRTNMFLFRFGINFHPTKDD